MEIRYDLLALFAAGVYFHHVLTSKCSKKDVDKRNASKNSVKEEEFQPLPRETVDSRGKFSEEDDLTLLQPMKAVHCIDNDGGIIVIGIAGGSGSGKTTLAKAIYENLGGDNVTFISHDSYYKDISHLSFEERSEQNFDHPDSLDTQLLVEHIKALKNKEEVSIPTYDYSTHSRLTSKEILPSRPIILVEGILIFTDPDLLELMDIRIFVDTDDDLRLIRRIQRDTIERGRSVKSVVQQYIKTVRPMHAQFVEPSMKNADIIVPYGINSVALDLVVRKLKSHL